MKRNEWKFQYTGSDLLGPCQRKERYHRDRLMWWRIESETTEQAIREKGIRLDEYQVTGGAQFAAQVDAGLSQRLSTCKRKIAEHESFVEQYASFRRCFDLNRDESLELDVDDMRFFGMGESDEDRVEEEVL